MSISDAQLEAVLKAANISLPQRRKLLNSMIVASAEKEESVTDNMPLVSAMASALTKDGFSAEAADRILGCLVRAGYAADDAGIQTLSASAANPSPVEKQALQVAKRWGITIRSGRGNIEQIDEALTKRIASTTDRVYIKTLLAQAGFID